MRKAITIALVLVFGALTLVSPASAGGSPDFSNITLAKPDVCYGTLGTGDYSPLTGGLITIDTTTGLGRVLGGPWKTGVAGLAIKSTGEMFGTFADEPSLNRIDAASGKPFFVAWMTNDGGETFERFSAIAFDEQDVLYGVGRSDDSLYTIATEDGIGIDAGDLTAIAYVQIRTINCVSGYTNSVDTKGMAFHPTTHELWGCDDDGDVYTIDTSTGDATLVCNVGWIDFGGSLTDIHFDQAGNLYGAVGGAGDRNYLISIPIPTPPSCTDVNEATPDANSTCDVAETYVLGTKFHGTLAQVAGEDWLAFDCNAGDQLTAVTNADGADLVDTQIELWNWNGTSCDSIITSNDNSGIGNYSKIENYTLPYTGSYRLKIVSATETGDYVCVVTCCAPATTIGTGIGTRTLTGLASRFGCDPLPVSPRHAYNGQSIHLGKRSDDSWWPCGPGNPDAKKCWIGRFTIPSYCTETPTCITVKTLGNVVNQARFTLRTQSTVLIDDIALDEDENAALPPDCDNFVETLIDLTDLKIALSPGTEYEIEICNLDPQLLGDFIFHDVTLACPAGITVCPVDEKITTADNQVQIQIELDGNSPPLNAIRFDLVFDPLVLDPVRPDPDTPMDPNSVDTERMGFTADMNGGIPFVWQDFSGTFISPDRVRISSNTFDLREITPTTPNIFAKVKFNVIDHTPGTTPLVTTSFFDDFAGVEDCPRTLTINPSGGSGDVNKDGVLTPADNACVKACFFAGGTWPTQPECNGATGERNGDTNCNLVCNLEDARWIFERNALKGPCAGSQCPLECGRLVMDKPCAPTHQAALTDMGSGSSAEGVAFLAVIDPGAGSDSLQLSVTFDKTTNLVGGVDSITEVHVHSAAAVFQSYPFAAFTKIDVPGPLVGPIGLEGLEGVFVLNAATRTAIENETAWVDVLTTNFPTDATNGEVRGTTIAEPGGATCVRPAPPVVSWLRIGDAPKQRSEETRLPLEVKGTGLLDLFYLDLGCPAGIEVLDFEPAGATAGWAVVDWSEVEPGLIRIGGFDLAGTTLEEGGWTNLGYMTVRPREGEAASGRFQLLSASQSLQGMRLLTDGVAVASNTLPVEFALGVGRPNPFRGSVHIEYAVPVGGSQHVDIKVYNVTGQLVSTLVNSSHAPGIYDVEWQGDSDSGNRVAPGMYFYRMKAGSFQETRKVVLTR